MYLSAMKDIINCIDRLDIELFETIESQTSFEDRRALLAVQRAYARKHKNYAYLEIGSHLGGTIQPYLADPRCVRIYSIDPRPAQQPDDRMAEGTCFYEENSTERMLHRLSEIECGDLEKIQCFEQDASDVAPEKIDDSPHVIFVDGEHTNDAVLSDFQFCKEGVRPDGVILFHDLVIIYPAIQQICKLLDQQGRDYLALWLEGSVFAIFFDPGIVDSDPHLASLYKRNKSISWLIRVLPKPLPMWARNARNLLLRCNAFSSSARASPDRVNDSRVKRRPRPEAEGRV